MNMKRELATIGYENAALVDFIATLQLAKISQLVDVRELPISRRKGFSKNALSDALSKVGIAYVHLKGLGDPKPGREAARAGNKGAFVRIFSAHLKTVVAQTDLAVAIEFATSGGACLMCYERAHQDCHRSLVAVAISAKLKDVSIRHLGVIHGNAAAQEKRARKGDGARQGATASR